MLTFRFKKCAYSVVCIIYLIWTKPVYTVASVPIFVHILNILLCKYKNSVHRFLCPKARNPKQSATASSTRGSCPNPTEECTMKKQWKMNWRLWDVYAHRQASTQHGNNLLIVKLLSPNLTSHSQTPHSQSPNTRTQITLHICRSCSTSTAQMELVCRQSWGSCGQAAWPGGSAASWPSVFLSRSAHACLQHNNNRLLSPITWPQSHFSHSALVEQAYINSRK